MTDPILSVVLDLTVCYRCEPLLRAPQAPRGRFVSKPNAEEFAQSHANAHGTKYKLITLVARHGYERATKIEIIKPEE